MIKYISIYKEIIQIYKHILTTNMLGVILFWAREICELPTPAELYKSFMFIVGTGDLWSTRNLTTYTPYRQTIHCGPCVLYYTSACYHHNVMHNIKFASLPTFPPLFSQVPTLPVVGPLATSLLVVLTL